MSTSFRITQVILYGQTSLQQPTCGIFGRSIDERLQRYSTGRTSKLLALCLACIFTGCDHKAQVDPAEVQRLVRVSLEQARAAERQTHPTANAGPAHVSGRSSVTGNVGHDDSDVNHAQLDTIANLIEPRCLSEAGADHVRDTATLLNQLKALMQGYGPPVSRPPEAPRLCLTAVAAGNDPVGAELEQSLSRDHRQQVEEVRSAANRAQAEFMRNRPIAWTWLRVWLDGQSVDIGSGLTALQEPELTKRVREGGRLHPEQPLFCNVRQADVQRGTLFLTCNGPLAFNPSNPNESPGEDRTFLIELPQSLATADAALATVGIGDLVQVQGHLMITRRFFTRRYSEMAQWVVREVEASAVSVVERSTCCAAAASGVAGADAGVP